MTNQSDEKIESFRAKERLVADAKRDVNGNLESPEPGAARDPTGGGMSERDLEAAGAFVDKNEKALLDGASNMIDGEIADDAAKVAGKTDKTSPRAPSTAMPTARPLDFRGKTIAVSEPGFRDGRDKWRGSQEEADYYAGKRSKREMERAYEQAKTEKRNELLSSGQWFDDGRGNIRLRGAFRPTVRNQNGRGYQQVGGFVTANNQVEQAGRAAVSSWDDALAAQQAQRAQSAGNVVAANRAALEADRARRAEERQTVARRNLDIYNAILAAGDALNGAEVKELMKREVADIKDQNGKVIGKGGVREVGFAEKKYAKTGFVAKDILRTLNDSIAESGGNYKITGILARKGTDKDGNEFGEPTFKVRILRDNGRQAIKTLTMRDLNSAILRNHKDAGDTDYEEGVAQALKDTFGNNRYSDAYFNSSAYRGKKSQLNDANNAAELERLRTRGEIEGEQLDKKLGFQKELNDANNAAKLDYLMLSQQFEGEQNAKKLAAEMKLATDRMSAEEKKMQSSAALAVLKDPNSSIEQRNVALGFLSSVLSAGGGNGGGTGGGTPKVGEKTASPENGGSIILGGGTPPASGDGLVMGSDGRYHHVGATASQPATNQSARAERTPPASDKTRKADKELEHRRNIGKKRSAEAAARESQKRMYVDRYSGAAIDTSRGVAKYIKDRLDALDKDAKRREVVWAINYMRGLDRERTQAKSARAEKIIRDNHINRKAWINPQGPAEDYIPF